jgi:CRP/FNR family transcriptional regulator, cyclic AMP receptor protein
LERAKTNWEKGILKIAATTTSISLYLETRKMTKRSFNARAFLAKVGTGRNLKEHRSDQVIFSQGDRANSIYYVQKGRIRLSVVSKQGKVAITAILSAGEFFGEECLVRHVRRTSTAVTLTESAVVELEKAAAVRVLREEPAFSEFFIRHLVSHNIRGEEDLVDQLCNSSEKRLARVLRLLANFGKVVGEPELAITKMSQQTLAEMVGATRSRVNFFMNKFRKLGFIDYKGHLKVHSSLNVVLRGTSARFKGTF